MLYVFIALYRTAIDRSKDAIAAARVLLTKINGKSKKILREAAAFLSEFLHLIKSRCDCELRNLYTGYIYKHERMRKAMVSTKQTVINYGKSNIPYSVKHCIAHPKHPLVVVTLLLCGIYII